MNNCIKNLCKKIKTQERAGKYTEATPIIHKKPKSKKWNYTSTPT